MSRDTFLRLYDERSHGLLTFFVRSTLNPEVAADLTAETFAAAFDSRARFDPATGDPGAWLHSIARHQLASYFRRRRVEHDARSRMALPEVSLSTDDHDRIESLIDFAQTGRLLQVALGDLSADQERLVIKRVVDGLSYRELADAIGCSEEAARTRVSRALRTLAASITRLATQYAESGGAK